MEWAFPTRTFQRMGLHGKAKGPNGIDERFASRSASGIGVGIMGRNKFPAAAGLVGRRAVAGLVGNNPAFHTPVIVLTHSGGLDVRIGGGVSTIRRFLGADLIDRTHIVLVPIILGRDERLWENTEGLEQRLPHRGGTLTQRCHPPDIRPTAPTRLTGRAIAGSHRSGGWRGSRAAVSPPPRWYPAVVHQRPGHLVYPVWQGMACVALLRSRASQHGSPPTRAGQRSQRSFSPRTTPSQSIWAAVDNGVVTKSQVWA